jgi:GTP pyrophosphokinase
MANQDFETKYRECRDRYKQLALRIKEMLDGEDGLLADISKLPVESRAKKTSSAVKKLSALQVDDPFEEIRDLAGIRVITYYHDDVERVADVIKSEFNIDLEWTKDKFDTYSPSEFGYRSYHLVGKINKKRAGLPEWKPYKSLWFEIQVRSVLQHAWAIVSHKLSYKSEEAAPTKIQRNLFRLSALFEIADDEFLSIRDNVDRLKEGYDKNMEEGEYDIDLNKDSLRQYIENSIDKDRWVKYIEEAGLNYEEVIESEANRTINSIVNYYSKVGYTKISDIHNMIDKYLRLNSKYFRNFYLSFLQPSEIPPLDVYISLFVVSVIYDSLNGDKDRITEFINTHRYKKEVKKYLTGLIESR